MVPFGMFEISKISELIFTRTTNFVYVLILRLPAFLIKNKIYV